MAYVSDAGTPAISDPGSRLVAAVATAGLRVIPLPGASSVTTLLSAAGCVSPDESRASLVSGFVFAGFLPTKGAERTAAIEQLKATVKAVVLFEAPHRIETLFKELTGLGERRVTVGRELTKQFESIVTMPAAELSAWLQTKADNARGEFALVLHPQATTRQDSENQTDTVITTSSTALLTRLLQELPLKTAVQITMDVSGLAKNFLYDEALQLKGRP